MFSVAKSLIKCRNVQMYLCVYLCHIYIRFHLEIYFSLYVSKGVLKDKLKSQNLLTLIWLFFSPDTWKPTQLKSQLFFQLFRWEKKAPSTSSIQIEASFQWMQIPSYSSLIWQLQIFFVCYYSNCLWVGCSTHCLWQLDEILGWNTVSLFSCFQNIGAECDSYPPE